MRLGPACKSVELSWSFFFLSGIQPSQTRGGFWMFCNICTDDDGSVGSFPLNQGCGSVCMAAARPRCVPLQSTPLASPQPSSPSTSSAATYSLPSRLIRSSTMCLSIELSLSLSPCKEKNRKRLLIYRRPQMPGVINCQEWGRPFGYLVA